MIIKNKNLKKNSKSEDSNIKKPSKSSILKKEDLDSLQKKPKNETKQEPAKKENNTKEVVEEGVFEKIDISSIEFKERAERRRGDRRRGYRRIDERSLVSRAQQEAHNIKELAAREGYQNGLKKAQDEIQTVQEAIKEFLTSKDDMYEDFYPHILELALATAKKIIKKEVELQPEILKEIIMSTLDELNSDTQKVEIKVNSSDVEFAKASLPEIIEAKGNGVRFSVSPDDSIEEGSCIVVANNGVIDANFRTQLAVLQTAFGIYQGGL